MHRLYLEVYTQYGQQWVLQAVELDDQGMEKEGD